ncbi:hypothetical protein [Streptomyces sp. NPDC029674]|uniref:hypothetical protein n=1 Tax=Streptomyces sp. NPDC029674 TaxID=3365297 RepID=UPI00384E9402
MEHSSDLKHGADVARGAAPPDGTVLPRVPRPRPRSPEPGILGRLLPGTEGPPAPAAVSAAFALWLTAAAAGVFETVLGVVRESSGAAGDPGGLPLRMAVFAAAVLVAVRMRRGARWTRWALTAVLGALGTLSLAAGPTPWPTGLRALGEAVAEAGAVDVLFGAGRVLHLAAALTATALMFRPAANAWFRAARHR